MNIGEILSDVWEYWKFLAIGAFVFFLLLLIAAPFASHRFSESAGFSLGSYPGEKLYTYYYRYPVLLVNPKQDTDLFQSVVSGERIMNIRPQQIRKYCVKIYEVGIGYDQAAIESYRAKICDEDNDLGDIMNMPEAELERFAPAIVSANAYRSYLEGYDQLQCDALDRQQYYVVDEDGRPARLRGGTLWLGNTPGDDSIGYYDEKSCLADANDGKCARMLLRNAILADELRSSMRAHLYSMVLKNSIKSLDGYVRLFCES